MHSASMTAKRAALADLILNRLNAISPGFRCDVREREAVLQSSSRPDRVAVVGEPTKYVGIEYTGPSDGSAQMNASGRALKTTEQFSIWIAFSFRDTDCYEKSSQAEWDELIASKELDSAGLPKGLIPFLRLANQLRVDGIVTDVSMPYDVRPFLNQPYRESGRSSLNAEYEHRLDFSISLT